MEIQSMIKAAFIAAYGMDFIQIPDNSVWTWHYQDMPKKVQRKLKNQEQSFWCKQGLMIKKNEDGISVWKGSPGIHAKFISNGMRIKSDTKKDFCLHTSKGLICSHEVEIHDMNLILDLLKGKFSTDQDSQPYLPLASQQFLYVVSVTYPLGIMKKTIYPQIFDFSQEGLEQALYRQNQFQDACIMLTTISDGLFYQNVLADQYKDKISIFSDFLSSFSQNPLTIPANVSIQKNTFELDIRDEEWSKLQRRRLQSILNKEKKSILEHPLYPQANDPEIQIFSASQKYKREIIPFPVQLNWLGIPIEKQSLAFRIIKQKYLENNEEELNMIMISKIS